MGVDSLARREEDGELLLPTLSRAKQLAYDGLLEKAGVDVALRRSAQRIRRRAMIAENACLGFASQLAGASGVGAPFANFDGARRSRAHGFPWSLDRISAALQTGIGRRDLVSGKFHDG